MINRYADDEANTQTKTVLLLKIGGGNHGVGIHGTHLGPGVKIRYASDPSRQNIPWVEYSGNGRRSLYLAPNTKPEPSGSLRQMDCMDCHNRPSHSYDMPERAVERAMLAGEILPSLPFAKKKSVEILRANHGSRAEAASKIPAAFERYYRESYAAVYNEHKAEVERSAASLLGIYNRNVFPEMKVGWGTYPNNIGHTDFPGCFRCHDDSHASSDGRKIAQDCNSCHNLLAMEEAAPKVLTDLGLVESKAGEGK